MMGDYPLRRVDAVRSEVRRKVSLHFGRGHASTGLVPPFMHHERRDMSVGIVRNATRGLTAPRGSYSSVGRSPRETNEVPCSNEQLSVS